MNLILDYLVRFLFKCMTTNTLTKTRVVDPFLESQGLKFIDSENFFDCTSPIDTFLINSVYSCQSKVFFLLNWSSFLNNCLISQLHTANQTFCSVFSKIQVLRSTFLKTGVVTIWIFSFVLKAFNQATNANNYCQHIWEYWQKISQWSEKNCKR